VINADRLPTLTTERLRIRWLEASDVPSLFEIFSDADVTRYWGDRTYKLPSSTTSEYGRYLKSLGEPRRGHRALRALAKKVIDLAHERKAFGPLSDQPSYSENP
jgi:RimJ/RimL family protein N-acetyltransferase